MDVYCSANKPSQQYTSYASLARHSGTDCRVDATLNRSIMQNTIRQCELLFCGRLGQQDLVVSYRDEPVEMTHDQLAIMEKLWHEALSSAMARNICMFNGNLFSLSDWEFHNHTLHLNLTNTSYKHYVATRQSEYRALFPAHAPANPLTVCAAIITVDNLIVLEKRAGVDVDEGACHVIGGFMDRDRELSAVTIPDPFFAIDSEIHEELGIPRHELHGELIGLVYDHNTPHPELCFEYRIDRYLDEINQYLANAPAGEVTEVFGIANEPEALAKFIENQYAELTVNGLGCLLLHGKLAFGERWWTRLRDFLNKTGGVV